MRFPRWRRDSSAVLGQPAEADRLVVGVQQNLGLTVLVLRGELSRATAAMLEEP